MPGMTHFQVNPVRYITGSNKNSAWYYLNAQLKFYIQIIRSSSPVIALPLRQDESGGDWLMDNRMAEPLF